MTRIYEPHITPPTEVKGTPTTLRSGVVSTVSTADGSVDVRAEDSRAGWRGLVPPSWYSPTVGDRVLLGDLRGDGQQVTIIAPIVAAMNPAIPEAWHMVGAAGEPAFANGWVNVDTSLYNPASFYKDRNRVYVRGLVKLGAPQVPIFTLPLGYRPDRLMVFSSNSSPDSHVRVDVQVSGAVVVWTYSAGGTNAYVSLDPISFRAG